MAKRTQHFKPTPEAQKRYENKLNYERKRKQQNQQAAIQWEKAAQAAQKKAANEKAAANKARQAANKARQAAQKNAANMKALANKARQAAQKNSNARAWQKQALKVAKLFENRGLGKGLKGQNWVNKVHAAMLNFERKRSESAKHGVHLGRRRPASNNYNYIPISHPNYKLLLNARHSINLTVPHWTKRYLK